MKRLLLPLALICGLSLSAPLAHADEFSIGPHLDLNLGYKFWVNNWQTVQPSFSSQGGDHYTALTQGGYGSIPNVSIKFYNFFMSGGYMATGNYVFPAYTDVIAVPTVNGVNAGHLQTVNMTASRKETDLSLGYMFIPQLGVTIGYKNVTQKYVTTFTSPGLTYANNGATTHTYYNGVTFGIVGAAPIGAGFSIYGNGVGGFMSVTYDPAATTNDTATYAASELGLAWHVPHAPLSFSFGYKYQILNTRSAIANSDTVLHNQLGNDVTQGYMLGMNLPF